jgi:spore coat protein U-like protein
MVSVTTTSGANGYNIYQNDTLIWNEAGGAVNIANSGFGVVRPFGGKVYAVMIYNRVLSANEISTIYNSMKSRYGL